MRAFRSVAALILALCAVLLIAPRLAPEAVRAQTAPAPATAAEPAAEPGAPIFLMPRTGPFSPAEIAIPNASAIESWARSGHADASAEAFSHWNAEGAIPPACATCHSGQGFRAFHGLDGSAPGPAVDPVPVGGVVDCETCHNPGMAAITEIALPSGAMHPVSSGEAACATCHQGRASGARLDQTTAGMADDSPNPELRFVNPHYKIALAVNLGGYGALGYQYEGRTYSGRFNHAKPVETCVACHDPHRLTVEERTCLTCHDTGDARAIRIARQSYDGSGDLTKGIAEDIRANARVLMAVMQDYAAQVAGVAMVHDGSRHPYFFADANGDGRADEAEGRPVAYAAFTPRLLRAAYNWKFVDADPGAHVHNPHYALELLYDSIADLSAALGRDIAALGIRR